MNLGNSRAYPHVYDFFPKLGRGHSQGKSNAKRNAAGERVQSTPSHCLACRTGDQKNHSGQSQNRKDWEESVGVRRTSRATRTAVRAHGAAIVASADPKELNNRP